MALPAYFFLKSFVLLAAAQKNQKPTTAKNPALFLSHQAGACMGRTSRISREPWTPYARG
ncbi:MAG: hypothetical protein IPM71_03905 [Bacteroidota bacterium]|nr:MAG: hypothetical protein IPM71_03905 [Bacteroidota bacterium]